MAIDDFAKLIETPKGSSGDIFGSCPWCGNPIASATEACPSCQRQPDRRTWVDSCHARAEALAPPGWEGLSTDEPLDNIANVTGHLRRELAALRIVGEAGRGEFWLDRANELYANIFRALSALRIWDRPEQLPKATDCDEAERRLDELWRCLAAKEPSTVLPAKLADSESGSVRAGRSAESTCNIDANKAAALKAIETHGGAIADAIVSAWNLREWVREATRYRTLQPVLNSLLPGVRSRLELSLIDGGLSATVAALPKGDELTAASLIAFVENLQLPTGITLRIPPGEPPIKWDTLSRKRALRIAMQVCGEDCKPLFDADSEDDLNRIEAMDGFLLAELWAAALANENDYAAKPSTNVQGGEAGDDPGPPKQYLSNWREILDALKLPNNAESKNKVRGLVASYNGPIVLPSRGGQPKVEKTKLIEWWNELDDRFAESDQRLRDRDATVAATHNYGRDATVAPNIGGSIKRRRASQKVQKGPETS
jgi:hypothetical protein